MFPLLAAFLRLPLWLSLPRFPRLLMLLLLFGPCIPYWCCLLVCLILRLRILLCAARLVLLLLLGCFLRMPRTSSAYGGQCCCGHGSSLLISLSLYVAAAWSVGISNTATGRHLHKAVGTHVQARTHAAANNSDACLFGCNSSYKVPM